MTTGGVEEDPVSRRARIEGYFERYRLAVRTASDAGRGMIAAVATVDPKYSPYARQKLDEIIANTGSRGYWEGSFEWRAMTTIFCRIDKTGDIFSPKYEITVECDKQQFSCVCPTPEKAFAFMELYQHLIIEQFYSIGPPWADTPMFEA